MAKVASTAAAAAGDDLTSGWVKLICARGPRRAIASVSLGRPTLVGEQAEVDIS
jgi:hypothetical protein